MYLGLGDIGTVCLDDPASVPAELGEDVSLDLRAIEAFLELAIDGLATAFHVRRDGCIEVRDSDPEPRTWHNAWPLPGWRRRAERIDYLPYRDGTRIWVSPFVCTGEKPERRILLTCYPWNGVPK